MVNMKKIEVNNPFNAPVYHEKTVGSTMDVARVLAENGEPCGTVIAADFQEAGRGRIRGRLWEMEKENSLPFTVLLRYPRIEDIPPALTLRTGLALALAIEDFSPSLAGTVMIKWPNDILIRDAHTAKKAAGILAEAENGNVYIGIGVNIGQKHFPSHLRDKATSIGLAAGLLTGKADQFTLLEKILARLYDEIGGGGVEPARADWQRRIEARLYNIGRQVSFAEGAADSGKIVSGILTGIGQGGELLIYTDTGPRSFSAGELLFPSADSGRS